MCAFCAPSCPFVLFLPFCVFADECFWVESGRPNSQHFNDDLVMSTQKNKSSSRVQTNSIQKSILSFLGAPIRESTKKQEKAEKARKGRESRIYVEKVRSDCVHVGKAYPFILMISLRARREHFDTGYVELQSQRSIRVLRIANPASCSCCRINASY